MDLPCLLETSLKGALMENQTQQKISGRAFVSFTLLISFILISVTGVILYLAPTGRVAYWIQWTLFGLSKEQWQAIHTVFSILFIILAVIHLFFINWKLFISYLRNKMTQSIPRKKELLLSALLTLLIFIGILFSVPPFRSIMNLGSYLTASWENTETAPPIPHAELLTLTELSQRLGNLSIEQIENRLKANGIQFTSRDQTLADIGKINHLAPIEIYNLITAKASTGQSGTGIGKKTLDVIAKEKNKEVGQILEILKAHNIRAEQGQTLKEIATENATTPSEIYEWIQE
jgi:hypothetical protein